MIPTAGPTVRDHHPSDRTQRHPTGPRAATPADQSSNLCLRALHGVSLPKHAIHTAKPVARNSGVGAPH